MREYIIHFTDGTKSTIILAITQPIAERMALAEPQSLGKTIARVEALN